MKNEIWQKIDRKHGFTEPGKDYFERFAARMEEQLPELEFPQKTKVTLWSHIQTWVYMAAMFVGIALMIRIFSPARNQDDLLAKEQSQEAFYDELIWTSCVDNGDVYIYLADAYDY